MPADDRRADMAGASPKPRAVNRATGLATNFPAGLAAALTAGLATAVTTSYAA